MHLKSLTKIEVQAIVFSFEFNICIQSVSGRIILKVVFDEEGNEFLADIEDDEEWEKVADAWQELVDNEEI